MSYTTLGGTAYADSFPDLHIHWQELLFFRSYQGAGLARMVYYVAIVAAVVILLANIILYTKALGAGGFFLGLLYGLLLAFFTVIGTRLVLELALSVFSIRDHLAVIAAQGGSVISTRPVTTPPQKNFPPAVYDTAVQPQSPSVFEPQQYQNGYQSQE